MSKPASLAAEKLKKLRVVYIQQLPIQLERARKIYAAIGQDVLVPQGIDELYRHLHSLQGACACFGLSALGSVAMEGEHLAKQATEGEVIANCAWREQLEDCLERIGREIASIDISGQ